MTDDPWLETSIMSKRGVAKGEAGRRHELSIEAQGPFHYVYGPYAKPVLTISATSGMGRNRRVRQAYLRRRTEFYGYKWCACASTLDAPYEDPSCALRSSQ